MRVGIKICKNDEKMFNSYDEAMNYIEVFISEIEALNISTDDIQINYYGQEMVCKETESFETFKG